MGDWSPAQYARFGDERLRPGLDLLARVPLEAPRLAYDLGCGTGTLTAAMKERWPRARIVGIDASESMLRKASETKSAAAIEWRRADLADWEPDPDRPPELLFSNAALHWLDDHDTLFPNLARSLAPSGILAVQMPNNFAAPTHRALFEAARHPRWRGRLEPLVRERPVLDPEAYHALLEPLAARLDVWETTYYHRLRGDDPVLEWTRGSVLRPFLQALDADERDDFLAPYRASLREAYPPLPDGSTLLPFKRLFLVLEARAQPPTRNRQPLIVEGDRGAR